MTILHCVFCWKTMNDCGLVGFICRLVNPCNLLFCTAVVGVQRSDFPTFAHIINEEAFKHIAVIRTDVDRCTGAGRPVQRR